jgi:hypothetical protein
MTGSAIHSRNEVLDRLGQQGTRSITQDFGKLIADVCWLNQLDDVICSFGREVEASSTPVICRLSDSRRHQFWAIAQVVLWVL